MTQRLDAFVATYGTRVVLVRARDEADARARVEATRPRGAELHFAAAIDVRPATAADLALIDEPGFSAPRLAQLWADAIDDASTT